MKLIHKKKMKGFKFSMLFIFSVLSGLAIYSCEKYSYDPPEIDPDLVISYEADIQTIFDNRCTACHNGSVNPDLTSPDSYINLSEGGYIESTPEDSELYTKLADGHSSSLTDIELQKIYAWIVQGAKDNK